MHINMRSERKNKAKTATAFLAVVLLASCLTDEQQFGGHGPLILSSQTAKALAWHELVGGYLAVSNDGEHYAMDYCGRGDCGDTGLDVLAVLQQCREKAKTGCGLFAKNGRIVWKGPLRVRAPDGSVKPLKPFG